MTPLMVHDPSIHLLGKADAKPPHMWIADRIDVERMAAEVPASVLNSGAGIFPLAMYGNDRAGDCTFAGIGNGYRILSKGKVLLDPVDIIQGYSVVTAKENNGVGYPAIDPGCVELDVLDYWTSIGVGGHRILGHGGINMKDIDQVRWGASLFGMVYLGIQLAIEQQSQIVWDWVPNSTPGSWGGHCVPLFDVNVGWMQYTQNPMLNVGGTWAQYKGMTDAFLLNQADEGHVVITQEWIDDNKGNPYVDAAALENDLKQIYQEV